MEYHVLDPDDIDPAPDRPCEMHYVSEAAGLSNLGLRTYRVQPGEEIPLSGLHYHDEQEEAFYVVDGELAVETPERVLTVPTGQFFVAHPESPHRAYNPDSADRPVEVIGVGAPPGSDHHVYEG